MGDEKVEILNLNEKKSVNKPDRFMRIIYISLVLLVLLGTLIYFFGYNLFKPFITV